MVVNIDNRETILNVDGFNLTNRRYEYKISFLIQF